MSSKSTDCDGRLRVCVIGAGVSGLPAIKSCLEQGNIDVVCYEKTSEVGGLWNYRPDGEQKGGATVMKSTVVNTSKEMMAYSDFPPPAEWPNFMHHSYVKRYLKMYARHFDLIKHIRFNVSVESVEQVGDDGWTVSLSDGTSENFDKVMLCTGHHVKPQTPHFNGIERFRGKVLHAKEYREFTSFEDKNVFIIGIGNSSLDIAVELSKVAKKVTISTRRGTWIFNRVAQCGMPYDIIYMTRFYRWRMGLMPWSIANDFMEHRIQQRIDHELYGLRPRHRFFQQHPTVNDALANLLASGLITITEDVDSFTEIEVIVKDGRRYPADIIIFATGYTFEFPFLRPQCIVPITNHQVDLYKFVFPPHLPNMAIIGLVQPIGSISPISEMQSRWAVSVFSGTRSLPDERQMRSDIAQKRQAMRRRYFHSDKHTIQVDFVDYMDELAELVGCRPQLIKLFFEDPMFALQIFFGANVPYVYRISGPQNWPKAREAICTVSARVKMPMKNRRCYNKHQERRGTLDEYLRYMSLKWIAGYSCLIFFTGLWVFCNPVYGISTFAYFTQILAFLSVFSLMLIWLDLQYDMTTVF